MGGAFYAGVYAILTTWALAVYGMVFPNTFTEEAALCYMAAMFGCFGAFAPIPIFLAREFHSRQLLITIFVLGAALVLLFAAIYRGYGFPDSDYAYWYDALYFSIVTWTTLGYGDLQPPYALRLLAAMEAFVGYVFLGLGIGLGANLLGRRGTRRA